MIAKTWGCIWVEFKFQQAFSSAKLLPTPTFAAKALCAKLSAPENSRPFISGRTSCHHGAVKACLNFLWSSTSSSSIVNQRQRPYFGTMNTTYTTHLSRNLHFPLLAFVGWLSSRQSCLNRVVDSILTMILNVPSPNKSLRYDFKTSCSTVYRLSIIWTSIFLFWIWYCLGCVAEV